MDGRHLRAGRLLSGSVVEMQSRLIRRGDNGPQVADVRRRLARATGDDIPPTGAFDEVLERHMRSFQRARGIAADGIVGPETWRNLVEAGHRLGDRLLWRTRVPMHGDDVMVLQHQLNLLGFDAGPEDGIFGALAQAAVEEFQRNIGLVVDGTVGPATVNMLNRLKRSHHSGGVGVRAREREALRKLSGRGVIGARVLVDPAHGPGDPGVVGAAGVVEAEITWRIASRLTARLQASGAMVDLSRGPRSNPDNSDRARLANELAVDIVLSIAVGGLGNPVARGASSYYFGSERFVSEGGMRLAELAQRAVVDAGWVPDCRIHPSTAPILRETRMPAVIVEPGFLSSPLDERKLQSGGWQDGLADALASAVTEFLSAGAPRPQDPTPTHGLLAPVVSSP